MRRREFLKTAALGGLFAQGTLLTTGLTVGLTAGSAGAAHAAGDAAEGPAGYAAPTRGTLAGPDLANARAAPGMLLHFLVRPQDTGGSFALLEGHGRKGMEPGPHVHAHEDEIVHLIDGRIRFFIGTDRLDAGPGDVVFMPRHVPHTFELQSETMRAHLMLTPGRLADYFWQVTRPAESLDVPPPATEPPPQEALQAMLDLMAEYGIERAALPGNA